MSESVVVLRDLKIGGTVVFRGMRIEASEPRQSTINPCTMCAFYDNESDEACGFKDACMAHKRKDRKSVVFKKLK